MQAKDEYIKNKNRGKQRHNPTQHFLLIFSLKKEIKEDCRDGWLLTGSAGIDVNMEGEDENSIESKEDKGVHRDCFAVGLHASEFDLARVTG